jgi:hypothetical protein
VWERSWSIEGFTFPSEYDREDGANLELGDDWESPSRRVRYPEGALLSRDIRDARDFRAWIDRQVKRLATGAAPTS